MGSTIDWLGEHSSNMLPSGREVPLSNEGKFRLNPQGSTWPGLILVPKRLLGFTTREPGRRLTLPEECQTLGEISHQATTFPHFSVFTAATDRLPKPTALPLETPS